MGHLVLEVFSCNLLDCAEGLAWLLSCSQIFVRGCHLVVGIGCSRDSMILLRRVEGMGSSSHHDNSFRSTLKTILLLHSLDRNVSF
jgi:hypothetical protein